MDATPTGFLNDGTNIVDLDIKTLRHLSTKQLQDLGKRQYAYLKTSQYNGKSVVILFGADGTPIFAVKSTEKAAEAAVQLGLDLIAVH